MFKKRTNYESFVSYTMRSLLFRMDVARDPY